jgi:hypothetical protein
LVALDSNPYIKATATDERGSSRRLSSEGRGHTGLFVKRFLCFAKKEEREIRKMVATKQMTLQERIFQIDQIQARRFAKLTGEALEIATEGIIRHLRACAKMDVNPDASAIREIIDDALNGRKVFAEDTADLRSAF